MNDQDYIRKAVELADDFDVLGRWNYRIQEPDQFPIFAVRKDPPKWFLAALAAQLVRQVDAINRGEYTNELFVWVTKDGTYISKIPDMPSEKYVAGYYDKDGEDRTMNTIKAIVDSGVLKKPHPRADYSGPMGQSL